MSNCLVECQPPGWHSYQEQFAQALEPYGVTVRAGTEFTNQALRASDCSAVHFHWIEYLWEASNALKRLRSIYGIRRYCRLAHKLGKRVLWTVHNHHRHEKNRLGDRLGFRTIAQAADLIIVHSQWSHDLVTSEFRPRGRIVRMPHGNFDGIYHSQQSSSAVRAELNLDRQRPVCGIIGAVRPYRGHELAIEAARAAAGRWQLLVAGHPIESEYGSRIANAVNATPGARHALRKLSDAEYAEYVRACDIILLPYQDITGSGALLAAWTLSRPVVMTDLPFFQELAPADPAAGLIVRDRTPEEINAAIGKLLSYPFEYRERAARTEADRYSWDEVIRPVAEVIRSWQPVERAPCASSF